MKPIGDFLANGTYLVHRQTVELLGFKESMLSLSSAHSPTAEYPTAQHPLSAQPKTIRRVSPQRATAESPCSATKPPTACRTTEYPHRPTAEYPCIAQPQNIPAVPPGSTVKYPHRVAECPCTAQTSDDPRQSLGCCSGI